eukprot:gnl/TRDRNA2_/TRDRNA2_154158_c0_seq2.p1 gnl/TRDRNA2_/TRDRNA2_154158_c0~~gnl/TRDRNA2_/TRDRNA2_154158_c0_seq2.p1  ORF type:complete len:263 (+),score=25.63 gnl/TRDRNA2_/TRDRNA2_154158_c0_seq2:400-1188(+)
MQLSYDQRVVGDKRKYGDTVHSTYEHFMSSLRNQSKVYCVSALCGEYAQRLVNDVNMPYFFPYQPRDYPPGSTRLDNVWMGYGPEESPQVTNAHIDTADNLAVLVSGRKQFKIWDPASAPGMYTLGKVDAILDDGAFQFAEDDHNPDIPVGFHNMYVKQRKTVAQVPTDDWGQLPWSEEYLRKTFPRFLNETSYGICELHPGDMLYLPRGFFHEVSSFGHHIMVNFWTEFKNGAVARMRPNNTYGLSVGERLSADVVLSAAK